ncbi:MAG: hypothetical protein J0H68_03895 [Sphingobacteriia bacterium]|nr:hypothetical protein [Sphingobacteriia bacterium]
MASSILKFMQEAFKCASKGECSSLFKLTGNFILNTFKTKGLAGGLRFFFKLWIFKILAVFALKNIKSIFGFFKSMIRKFSPNSNNRNIR